MLYWTRKELLDIRKEHYNKHAWKISTGYMYITYKARGYNQVFKTLTEFEKFLWTEDYQRVIDIGYGLMYREYFNGIQKKSYIIHEIMDFLKNMGIYKEGD